MVNSVHICIFIGLFFINLQLGEAREKKLVNSIKMVSGSLKEVELGQAMQVQVDKKNVLEVEWQGGRKWVLIAKHWGVAVINLFGDQGQLVGKWVVRVVSSTSAAGGKLRENQVHRFCGQYGFLCDANHIRGRISSLYHYFLIRSQCELQNNCRFSAKIHRRALSSFKKKISNLLGPTVKISRSLSKQLVLEWPCHGKVPGWLKLRVHSFFSRVVEVGGLVLSCRGREEDVTLNIEVFYLKKSEAEKIGLNWSMPSLHSFDLPSALTDYLMKDSRRILGKGVVSVRAPGQISWQSGGELKLAGGGEKPDGWHPVGLILDLEVVAVMGEQISLSYSLKLASPGESSDHLDSSVMKSETFIKRGKKVVLGSFDAGFSGSTSENRPFMSLLPLLGPLFKVTGEAGEDVSIYLTVEVSPG